VSKIDEVHWEKKALDHLVLDETAKSMLLGLVQWHSKNKDKILSDVIPSKGKASTKKTSGVIMGMLTFTRD
jgi:hypothetical protein